MAVGKCIYIILPKSMILPQIKMLGLVGIAIPNLEFQRLFSSCPLLESVVIKKCDVQTNNQSNIVIDSRSLKLLVLVDNRHTHIGPADHSLSYTTKIYAPNAKDFTCTGFMREDFSLENLSSLVSASFEMSSGEEDETAETYSELPTEEKEVFAKRMLKLLGGVQNVRHLSLSSGFLEVLLQGPGTLYRQPLQLCNLLMLKLEMRFTRGCLRSIAYLLKISPIVKTLKLKSMESNLADIGDDWEVGLSLTGMISHLKFVEIREVEGCENELKFFVEKLASFGESESVLSVYW
ncbi:uncharacterized protein LOC113301985 [Papaver somniferum]|uniref:uncharacterized protein LOC113301985 n=1 Tax=Papaver somniferum TaxID=3469 RepID=UPI000E700F2A|nr:uncharacterized protein LOC113301985 [Papaver somniferum]